MLQILDLGSNSCIVAPEWNHYKDVLSVFSSSYALHSEAYVQVEKKFKSLLQPRMKGQRGDGMLHRAAKQHPLTYFLRCLIRYDAHLSPFLSSLSSISPNFSQYGSSFSASFIFFYFFSFSCSLHFLIEFNTDFLRFYIGRSLVKRKKTRAKRI